MTILIIDDDAVTIAALEGILRREGFRTIHATSAPAGRALAVERRPDLVLLDVGMPGENGIEACRRLHADPRTSEIPVLFLSADQDVASKVAGLEAGGVDYVTKPFHRAEVLARVRTHLRLAAAHRALLELQAARLSDVAAAQQSILVRPEDFPDARFAVHYRPLHAAGGDFYDVLRVGDGVFDYVVADVSGHDVGASLATAALKALVRQNATLLHTPAEILQAVNRVLCTVLGDGQHVTLAYARLNRSARRLTLVSAGHPPPLLAHRGEAPSPVRVHGDVLGAFEAVSFDSVDVSLAAHDRLFLYSDGMVEVDGNAFTARERGIAALAGVCATVEDVPLAEAADAIPAAVFRDRDPGDDLVLLCVEA